MNQLSLLASQGVPLAFGSDRPATSLNRWASVRDVPALPRLNDDDPLPRCVRTVHRGQVVHG